MIRDIIHNIKFRSDKRAAQGLARWWARQTDAENFAGAELLVPVPMHPRKKRKRGFNQAEILAAALSAGVGIPADPSAILRTHETPPLSGLSPRQRAQQVADAFTVNPICALTGKHICLIDDIFTTGATLDACAKLLRTHGAARVSGRTLAIAVKKTV